MFSKGKVLVTGGAGFIGSHQVDRLIADGYNVVVVVDNLISGTEKNLNQKSKFYLADIRSEKIDQIFEAEKPDYVFHFAAQISLAVSLQNPIYDADVNIVGGLNVLQNCYKHKIKKIIFSSSGGALYDANADVPTQETALIKPISPYGLAKFTFENYLDFYYKNFGLKYGIVRYANVYGPRQKNKGEGGVISIFIDKLLKNEQPIINGDGHQTRDYVFVSDVVEANMKVFLSDKVDKYNVATSRQTTVNEIFYLINNKLQTNLKEKHQDVFAGQKISCLSYEKINQALNWQPKIDIATGINQTLDWFIHN